MAKRRGKRNPVDLDGRVVPPADWRARLWLPLILLLALLVRVIALMNLSDTVYGDFLLWDERVYHQWAERISTGTYRSRTVYQGAPVPAYLMAAIYWLFSPNVLYVRILNVCLGVFTCWLVYLIGTNIANRRTGLRAGLLACLCKPFIFYSVVPLKESLAVCLFAGTAYLLISLVTEKGAAGLPGTRRAISVGLLGVVVGLLLNTRPNAIVLLPVLPLISFRQALREEQSLKDSVIGVGIYVLGVSCAMSPFVIRNYRVAGTFAVTTSQSGINLYLGNNLRNPDPYYRPVAFAISSPLDQSVQFTIEASRRVGRRLSPSEASDYWIGEVTRLAASNPRIFARKIGQKFLVLVNRFEACDHYDIDFVGNFARVFAWPFPGFGFVVPLAAAGIGGRLRRSRKAGVSAAVLGLYGVTLIAFFSNARYRLPMLALIIPFAALALDDLVSSWRETRVRRVMSSGAMILAAAFVSSIKVQATDDSTAYYNTHAIILDARGHQDEAILYWKRSSELQRPYSAFANLSLATKYFERGERVAAHAYLRRIPDDSFAAADKYELVGDDWLRQKNLALAARAYEKSLEINSGRLASRAKLAGIYERIDPARAVREKQRYRYVESFYQEVRGT